MPNPEFDPTREITNRHPDAIISEGVEAMLPLIVQEGLSEEEWGLEVDSKGDQKLFLYQDVADKDETDKSD